MTTPYRASCDICGLDSDELYESDDGARVCRDCLDSPVPEDKTMELRLLGVALVALLLFWLFILP